MDEWKNAVSDVKSESYRLHEALAHIAYEVDRLDDMIIDLENIRPREDEAHYKAGYLRSSFNDSSGSVERSMDDAADAVRSLRQMLNGYL